MRTKTKRPKSSPRARTLRRSLAEQLRELIVQSGYSDNALAEAAGLDPSSVGRFLRGERSWTLDTADRLAAVLGLELVRRAGRAPRPAAAEHAPDIATDPHFETTAAGAVGDPAAASTPCLGSGDSD